MHMQRELSRHPCLDLRAASVFDLLLRENSNGETVAEVEGVRLGKCTFADPILIFLTVSVRKR